MKIEKTFTDDHQVKLVVEYEPSMMEDYKHRAARELSKRVKVPGFRPGKAPFHLVERTVGTPALMDEAIEILVRDSYPKVLDEAEIKPYGPGSLENIEKLDPPLLTFIVPLEPEVTLGDYRAIRVPFEMKTISDQEVTDSIEELRDRYATFEPVERPAQDGDQVALHLAAERKNPAEGQSVTLIRDRDTALTINPADEDVSREWPFPGFSRHMAGMQAGDEKTFEYTYDAESALESLRGTEAVFHIKVDAVKLSKRPELNDEFAQTVSGEYADVAQLTQDVRKHLEEHSEHDIMEAYHEKIMDEIIKDAQVKFPPQMLEREEEGMLEQLKQRLSQQGLDYETYLKTRDLTDSAFREELRPTAETRLRRSLVLLEVLKLEDIHVTPEALEAEVMRTLQSFSGMLPPEEMKRLTGREEMQNLVGNISSDLLIQNCWKRLETIAKGEFDPEAEAAAQAESASASEDATSSDATSEGATSDDAASDDATSDDAAEETAPSAEAGQSEA